MPELSCYSGWNSSCSSDGKDKQASRFGCGAPAEPTPPEQLGPPHIRRVSVVAGKRVPASSALPGGPAWHRAAIIPPRRMAPPCCPVACDWMADSHVVWWKISASVWPSNQGFVDSVICVLFFIFMFWLSGSASKADVKFRKHFPIWNVASSQESF